MLRKYSKYLLIILLIFNESFVSVQYAINANEVPCIGTVTAVLESHGAEYVKRLVCMHEPYTDTCHCYDKLHDRPKTWEAANHKCKEMGGHLLTIDSEQEYEALNKGLYEFYHHGRFYIGLEKLDNKWMWLHQEGNKGAGELEWFEGISPNPNHKYGILLKEDVDCGIDREDCDEIHFWPERDAVVTGYGGYGYYDGPTLGFGRKKRSADVDMGPIGYGTASGEEGGAKEVIRFICELPPGGYGEDYNYYGYGGYDGGYYGYVGYNGGYEYYGYGGYTYDEYPYYRYGGFAGYGYYGYRGYGYYYGYYGGYYGYYGFHGYGGYGGYYGYSGYYEYWANYGDGLIDSYGGYGGDNGGYSTNDSNGNHGGGNGEEGEDNGAGGIVGALGALPLLAMVINSYLKRD